MRGRSGTTRTDWLPSTYSGGSDTPPTGPNPIRLVIREGDKPEPAHPCPSGSHSPPVAKTGLPAQPLRIGVGDRSGGQCVFNTALNVLGTGGTEAALPDTPDLMGQVTNAVLRPERPSLEQR